jgi:tryptophanase
VVDIISDAAHDFASAELFKGNVDLNKLETVFKEQGEKVCCVYVELAVNSCGGHPVSLGNLKAVKVSRRLTRCRFSLMPAGFSRTVI